MSIITCGSKNPELPYLDIKILTAFSTSEENFRPMGSPESCWFGGCHAEAAPQPLLDEATGSQGPWGPLRRGVPGWRQCRVAAGQQNRGLAGLMPMVEQHHTELRSSHGCTAPMAMQTGWMPQIQQIHFLQLCREALPLNCVQLSYSTHLLLRSFKWK